MVTSRASELFRNMTGTGKTELEAKPNGLTRREAARRLLGGISAGAFLQFGAAGHPIWKHLADDALLDKTGVAETTGSPRSLSSKQYVSLVAVADAIVPGSTKANVAEFIDLLLGLDTEKNQTEFLESLRQVETESHKKFAKDFPALTGTQRTELLAAIEESAAFKNLKTWVSGAYYSSEVGMRELGWTPNRFFPQFPGCEHSEEHASD